jgi:hypothetical protein
MKKFLLVAAFLSFVVTPLYARVNLLEPWTPGVDFSIPVKDWTHGADLRLGFDKTDLFQVDYFLSHPLYQDWEVEGTLGYVSLDRPGGGHSGLNDLAVAAKYRFPQAMPGNMKVIGEGGISLPTGNPDNGIGAGGVGAMLGWGMQVPIQVVTGYAHLGLNLFTEGGDTRWGSIFSYTLGAQYELDPELSLTADIRGFNHGKDKINGVKLNDTRQEVYLAPGALWHPASIPLQFLGSILIGLSHDAYNLGLMAGVKY